MYISDLDKTEMERETRYCSAVLNSSLANSFCFLADKAQTSPLEEVQSFLHLERVKCKPSRDPIFDTEAC